MKKFINNTNNYNFSKQSRENLYETNLKATLKSTKIFKKRNFLKAHI